MEQRPNCGHSIFLLQVLLFAACSLLLNPSKSDAQNFWIETFGLTAGGLGSCDQATPADLFNSGNGAWHVSDLSTPDSASNTWYISAAEPGLSPGTCATRGCFVDPSYRDRTLHIGNVSNSPNALGLCPSGDCGAFYDPGNASNSVSTDKRAESPAINATGRTGIVLSFNYFGRGDNGNNDVAYVEYFDGISWATLQALPQTDTGCGLYIGYWTHISMPLPASANNNAAIKIGFTWLNDNGGIGLNPSIAIDSIVLTASILPVANFYASDTIICKGDCINFIDTSLNSPTTYAWTFTGAATPSANVPNPSGICYNTPDTFDVRLIVSNAAGSDTLTRTLYITVGLCQPPVPGFTADTTVFCERTCVNFSDTSQGATAWFWRFPGGTPDTSNSPNPVICYFTPGTYPVTLIASNQYGSDSIVVNNFVTVQVCPLPEAGFTAFPTNLCSNHCVAFTDTSTETPIAWLWSFPGGIPDTDTLRNPSCIRYPSDGFYDVSLIVWNQYGSDTVSQTSYIRVESVPSAFVNNDTTMDYGSVFQLMAGGGTSYQWYPSTGLTSPVPGADSTTIPNPLASPTFTTTYTVAVSDSSGCTALRQVTVTVLHDDGTFVPNTFSPNGDGRNDVLYLHGNNLYGVRFTIFDRWGEKIFETTDQTQGWDGTYKGKVMDSATFSYVITVNFEDGKSVTQSGNVTLLR